MTSGNSQRSDHARPPRRRRAVTGAVAALLLAVALPAGPSAAEDCFPDPTGDTVAVAKDDPEAQPRAADEARADLVRHCATLTTQRLSVSARVVQPTDPADDPGWSSPHTSLVWLLDTDLSNDEPEYLASLRQRDGAASARVVDGDGAVRCDGSAAFDGSDYTVTIPADCLGAPTEISLGVRLSYDTLPDDPSDGLFTDDASVGTRPFGRIAGPSRFGTALGIGRYAFPDTAASVYLAGADSTADAVVAGSLTDGPIILVPQCADEAPDYVREEIARLDPSEVVALGGEAAVCEELLLSAAGSREAVRVAGVSRIGTAIAVAQRAFPDGASTVFLAEAATFADAVAAGALTAGPTLLVPSETPVPEPVLTEIRRLAPAEVVALGGRGAVSDGVLAEAAQGRPTRRIAGTTRIETAAAIAQEAFPERAQEVYLARADVLVDAVVAGTLSAGPVLLVPTFGELPEAVRAAIVALGPVRVMALGGRGAVSDAMLHDAAAAR